MTVGELIDELQEHDENDRVVFSHMDLREDLEPSQVVRESDCVVVYGVDVGD